MTIRMQVAGTGAAIRLSFPDHEDGTRLVELASLIAGALGAEARHPKGSLLECLISFDAYPEEFALWWDGFTCELGCSALSGVAMNAVADQLIASGAFEAE